MSSSPDASERTPSEFAHMIATLRANDAASVAAKETWVNWLSEYDTPGYYNRKGSGYDARFAYNHIQNPEALLWLAESAGVEPHSIQAAREAVHEEENRSSQAAAVRQHVAWSTIKSLLWENY